MQEFLPISREEMEKRGWSECDFILITGDAYVDHPSFGAAIISRVLENRGYRVGIISQPDWKSDDDIQKLGRPKLAFLITGGNIDSMVNHYSVAKKRRDKDAYTPGGVMGKRPDRATTVYSNLVRRIYKDVPIVLGGIEASLRRLAHYDYWSDKVKRSVLLDAQADMILFGMSEKAIVDLAEALESGLSISDITYINGTVYRAKEWTSSEEAIILPSYEDIKLDKKAYAQSFKVQMEQTDGITAKILVEAYGEQGVIVQRPPSPILTQREMDAVYALPYTRNYHPSYDAFGGVPAIEEVKFSIISNRGCFGGCNFCALTFHQGRIMQSRSKESIINEAAQFVWEPDFKGYIHDVGGPTANFRKPSCRKQLTKGVCQHKQCMVPEKCKHLEVDHKEYLDILRELRRLPKVKKVFIRSGIRFDYLMYDKDNSFMNELCEHHVSGQLKVAPEHVSNKVLDLMGKPHHPIYKDFTNRFQQVNQNLHKEQYLVPYLMSSHPGSDLSAAIELAEYLRDIKHQPQQVQDFYPTPATLSTTMYYTGLDPITMKPVYVPKTPHEKAMQRALIQYRTPYNYDLVKEALLSAGREDLIGFDVKCLIRPRGEHHTKQGQGTKGKGQGTKVNTEKSQKPHKPQKRKTIRNVHKKKK